MLAQNSFGFEATFKCEFQAYYELIGLFLIIISFGRFLLQ